ncbi:MAG: ACT domain-containing protein [Candidatus Thorarchaeota archaeon]|nr:ACT domain-containing protein [Candidatus Thorarchaeota archaeon]
MSGERNLDSLVKNMSPVLIPGEFVFSTTNYKDLNDLQETPLLIFHEQEAITIVVRKEIADLHGLEYEGIWGLITLTIHSDLSAIGFLAALTKALAEGGISVNVVSAYFHDHLFVPYESVRDALSILENLSQIRER